MIDDIIVLENNFIKVEINKINGAIQGIYNKKTKWQVIQQPKLAMGLQLLIPIQNQRNHRALSHDQTLSNIKMINNQECELFWDKIEGEKIKHLDIKVVSKITLKETKITFDLTVENNSGYRIDEISYPCFGGVRPPANTKTFRTRTINMCGSFQNTNMLSPFPQARGYWGVNYPTFINEYPSGRCIMPFELIELDDQGIYFGAFDDENNNIYFLHEFRPGFIDSKHNIIPETDEISGIPAGYVFTMVRTPFLKTGEKIKLAPVVFQMYEGDWHEGLKPYILWHNSWYKQKAQPSWLKDVDCWQSIIMSDPVGTIYYKYKDLIDVAIEARSKGVKALQIIGWNKGGLDGRLPYFETDQRLGTREEFKDVIKKIEEAGIRVILLCKFSWADATTQEFENEIKQFTVKDFYGKNELYDFSGYQTITGSGTVGSYLCYLSADFRKFAVKQLENIIELGASGIQNDQMTPSGNCFDTSHHHRWGESICKGALLMAEEFYSTVQRLNKDFILTGEGPTDQISQYYPVNYIRSGDYYYWLDKHVPAWKYINPDMMFATCITGWDDREMINQCLTYGYIINYEPYNFKGRLADIPLTVEYGQKALKLRRKLWDYIWLGKFLDTTGAEVKPLDGNDKAYYYSVFQNRQNAKKAIVITNDDKTYPLTVEVKLSDRMADFDIYSVDNQEIGVYKKYCTIPPRSLVVLVEK
jgi:hypothetical protein